MAKKTGLHQYYNSMKRIVLKKGEEHRIKSGHPWVYNNEVLSVFDGKNAKPCGLDAGECADIETYNKHYLGRAFVNPHSKIIARIYSPSKEGADSGFFKRRLREAFERRNYRDKHDSLRLVFGEADFLPGLIIDRFVGWSLRDIETNDIQKPLEFDKIHKILGEPSVCVVVQILSFGMEARREIILKALVEMLFQFYGEPLFILEKSSINARQMEGLPPGEGIISGTVPEDGIVIFENGYPFIVEFFSGQKTGHFLDQAENHRAAAVYAQGKKIVLDAFCYTGGFAVHCARSGAEKVIAADSSKNAILLLKRNAVLNNVADTITTVETDVFELLTKYECAKKKFDLIVLDPPAFAKSRQALDGAIRGYKEINLKALLMLNKGGMLITSSCSFALSEINFKRIIHAAAQDAGKRIIQTEFRTQSPCHPILVGYDESHYLKCGIFTII
ncbi:MAG: class I SAM-dependent rRNA methyltransferase [Spirochaetaceae bacterium]|jgi:23S rRNA (cytosine1962-C5)-methyltransferase|nr:class I SAM-dependent rRNA methyltransferase [Spirochaetaceae bacterium]